MIWNTDLVESLEYENLIQQALVTNEGADHPARKAAAPMPARIIAGRDDDVNWMKHSLTWLDPETGKVRIDYRPVHTYTLTNDVEYIPPKARTY